MVLTVPMDLAVSGVPSPFLLFSGSLPMSVECLVAVVERPNCLLEMAPWSPFCGSLAVAAWMLC